MYRNFSSWPICIFYVGNKGLLTCGFTVKAQLWPSSIMPSFATLRHVWCNDLTYSLHYHFSLILCSFMQWSISTNEAKWSSLPHTLTLAHIVVIMQELIYDGRSKSGEPRPVNAYWQCMENKCACGTQGICKNACPALQCQTWPFTSDADKYIYCLLGKISRT